MVEDLEERKFGEDHDMMNPKPASVKVDLEEFTTYSYLSYIQSWEEVSHWGCGDLLRK